LKIIAIALLLIPLNTYSEFYTGIQIRDMCRVAKKDVVDDSFCKGYYAGVIDTTTVWGLEVAGACLPDGLKLGEASESIRLWLTQNGDKITEEAFLNIIYALKAYYPCEEEK
jgi:hypothetical protein